MDTRCFPRCMQGTGENEEYVIISAKEKRKKREQRM